jgi:hypothetical protein
VYGEYVNFGNWIFSKLVGNKGRIIRTSRWMRALSAVLAYAAINPTILEKSLETKLLSKR